MAEKYEVGNLDLTIQGFASKTVKSLDTVISKLTTIDNLLNKSSKGVVDTLSTSTVGRGRKGGGGRSKSSDTEETLKHTAYAIDTLGKKYLQLETIVTKSEAGVSKITTTYDNHGKAIKKITEEIDELGQKTKSTIGGLNKSTGVGTTTQTSYAVDELGKKYKQLETVTTKSANGISKVTTTFNSQGKEIKKVTEEIDEYGNKIKNTVGSGKEIKKVTKEIEEVDKKIKKTIAGGEKTPTSTKSMWKTLFNIGKFRIALHYARRLGSAIQQVVQYGSQFDETLNMWQVAFRNNLDSANKFVKTMQKAYGISTETLMQNQAIYKNMLSQMGELTEDTSYRLSEALTLMVLDYASLWNTTIQSASEKFKAMLAGQIRPIRSISGISTEEKAIYDIYRGMGGDKTMRQLNQTEKRLLRIYATFSQMQQSGATGDFAKTIEKFANQSRLMSEYWKELVTWIGLGAKGLIESSGILQYINAGLIFTTEIIKGLVHASGYQTPDFLEGMFETVEGTNEGLDELQGKLLDFDKFNALQSSQGGAISIDKALLDKISSYTSSIANATNKAQELAQSWLDALGFVDENNDGVLDLNESLTKAKVTLNRIWEIAVTLIGLGITSKIVTLIKGIEGATLATKALNVATQGLLYGGLFLISYSLIDLITNWDNLTDSQKGTQIGLMALGVAMVSFTRLTKIGDITLKSFNMTISGATLGITAMTTALSFLLFNNVFSKLDEDTRKWAVTLGGVIGALTTIAGLLISLKNPAFGLPIAGVGIGLFGAGLANIKIPQKGSGGTFNSGDIIQAGERGAEIVYSNSNTGGGGVVNVQQISEAIYRGNMMFWQQAKRDIQKYGSVTIQADSQGIFKVVTDTAHKQGKDWVNKV